MRVELGLNHTDSIVKGILLCPKHGTGQEWASLMVEALS